MRAIFMLVILLFVGTMGLLVAAPDRFEIERAVSIKASPARVFPLINDLRSWSRWSAWQETDPDLAVTYHGPRSGKGAVYSWNGNEEVGTGLVEITESRYPSRVRIKLETLRAFTVQNIVLDFVPPLEVAGTAEFVIVQRGGATVVTCTLKGKYSLVDKLKGLAARMDIVLGHEINVGLANLKKLVDG